MKRITLLICAFTILLSLCSCANNDSSFIKPVTFYYKMQARSENECSATMVSEMREAKGYDDNYEILLQQYLNGPQTTGYISPFPPGTTLEEFGFFMGRAQIVLSSHLSMLSGYDLTLACSCLARTVLEMTDVKAVQISASEGLLNGKEAITIRNNSFVLEDDFRGIEETLPN